MAPRNRPVATAARAKPSRAGTSRTAPARAARRPGPTGSVTSLGPRSPADVAVASTLLGFLDRMGAMVRGTVEDLDPEFLHELRVAVRRSRSALKLTGDVLPERTVGRLLPDLIWLGDLTTPVRDLDVHLSLLPKQAERLVAFRPDDLAPLREHLQEERKIRHRALVEGLRSARFVHLCTRYRQELGEITEGHAPAPTSPPGSPTFAALAGDRIGAARRTVRRAGRAITPQTPAERLHALRKRCKELRYLIQLFEPALDPGPTRVVTKHLKKLQEVLGAFQDCEVQRQALTHHAERMAQTSDQHRVPITTLLAMGELTMYLAQDQTAARTAFADRFARFDSAKVRRQADRLVLTADNGHSIGPQRTGRR